MIIWFYLSVDRSQWLVPTEQISTGEIDGSYQWLEFKYSIIQKDGFTCPFTKDYDHHPSANS